MIIALLNQPHGVGKTTLALHLAGLWSYQTRHVTVIDADPQGRTLEWSEMRRRNGCRGASRSSVSRGTRFTATRRTSLVTSIA
jgi:cellulose biosynthesis protein BcsQ